MKLMDAFQVRGGDLVALVGAGGKSSAMSVLGEEAVKIGFRVVLTTTTKIYLPPVKAGRPVLMGGGREIVDRVRLALRDWPLVVAGAGAGEGNKLLGMNREMPELFLGAGADLVLVEADGAAGRPFKAPREGEPVIPRGATAVVPVVGIDCLGLPLSADHVHRPEMVTLLAGIKPGQTVTPATVARVLFHPGGYRKEVPPGSRWIPFINKVLTPADLARARELADLLGRGGAKRVVIGSTLAEDPASEVAVF